VRITGANETQQVLVDEIKPEKSPIVAWAAVQREIEIRRFRIIASACQGREIARKIRVASVRRSRRHVSLLNKSLVQSKKQCRRTEREEKSDKALVSTLAARLAAHRYATIADSLPRCRARAEMRQTDTGNCERQNYIGNRRAREQV